MAWADVISRGGGKVAFRVKIEGYATEWVTADRLVGSSTHGRTRRIGLQTEGLRISATIIPAESGLSGGGCQFSIVDMEGVATSEYARVGKAVLILTADCTGIATTLQVSDTSSITVGDYLHIDGECVQVTAKTSSTIDVDRGLRDTIAQYHYSSTSTAGGKDAGRADAALTDYPYSMRGRRCWLYAYGDEETGAGTLVFKGVITAPPRRTSGTVWSFAASDLSSVLDQEIGSVSLAGDAGIKGYYFPWTFPLRLSLYVTPTVDDINTGPLPPAGQSVTITGYYSTPDALATALQTAIDATSYGTGGTFGSFLAVASATGVKLQFRTDATKPRLPRLGYQVLQASYLAPSKITLPAEIGTPLDVDGNPIDIANPTSTPLSANKVYDISTPGLQFCLDYPFSWFGGLGDTGQLGLAFCAPSAVFSAPQTRIHLDRDLDIAAVDRIQISGAQFAYVFNSARNSPANPTDNNTILLQALAVGTESDGTIYIDLAPRGGYGVKAVGGSLKGEIKVAKPRFYSSYPDGVSSVIDQLITDSPEATFGDTPFLPADDWGDYSTETTIASGGSTYLTQRTMAFVRPVKLRELIVEELKLLGCYLVLDNAGRLAAKRLVPPQEQTAATTIHPIGVPEFACEDDGIYNVVELSTLYDSAKDQWAGGTYSYRDTVSMGLIKSRRSLTIKPKSNPVSPSQDLLDAHISQRAAAVFGLFGRTYATVTVEVPIIDFNVQLGDTVLVTHPLVPNQDTGDNGVILREMLVCKREWDLASGKGQLGLYMFAERSRGYAPSAKMRGVDSVDNGGDNFTLAFETTVYAPPGTKDVTYFAVGDTITILRRPLGSWSGSTPVGTIQSIDSASSPNTMTVQFDSAMPGGWPDSQDYIAVLQIGDTTPTTNMSKYCYVAGDLRTVGNLGRPAEKMGG